MDNQKKFQKAHKRVMVNFTHSEWKSLEVKRKGESDSSLVKRFIFAEKLSPKK